jgi:hypothetical protein
MVWSSRRRLYGATRSFTHAVTASMSISPRGTTRAMGTSPRAGSGAGTTAASATCG